jgi:hypothetical protein
MLFPNRLSELAQFRLLVPAGVSVGDAGGAVVEAALEDEDEDEDERDATSLVGKGGEEEEEEKRRLNSSSYQSDISLRPTL